MLKNENQITKKIVNPNQMEPITVKLNLLNKINRFYEMNSQYTKTIPFSLHHIQLCFLNSSEPLLHSKMPPGPNF